MTLSIVSVDNKPGYDFRLNEKNGEFVLTHKGVQKIETVQVFKSSTLRGRTFFRGVSF